MLLEPIRVLTPDGMERIHRAALDILADVGMKIESEKAHEYLRTSGCRTDTGSFVVRFPREVVQRCVDRMRRAYDHPDRLPARMSVRYSHIRFRREKHAIHPDFTASTGGFCCFIHDLEGRRRPATLDDVHRAIHLVNRLDDVNYTGLPISDQESPAGIRPVRMAAEIAKYTTKFGGVETFRVQDVPYLIEIGTIVKGSLEALKREPILVGYAEVRTPLCFDRNMVEIFMEYIRLGFPQTLDSMPNAGATAPVTEAGTLALGMAETLAGLVLAHAIDENAVVGVDNIPSTCDMHTGLFPYGSAGRTPLLVGRIQMISEYYGCPSGVHGGKTDSCFHDVQAGAEKAWSVLTPVLAGAVGIGTIGHLENAVTFSPVQLVLDAEIVRAVRRILKPVAVTDETLATDVIRRVGIGGNFLAEAHTVEHFREELFRSEIFPCLSWDSAHSGGARDAAARAREKALALWSETPEPVLDADKHRAVEAVVARAARAAREMQA